jgi:hypothetical protein
VHVGARGRITVVAQAAVVAFAAVATLPDSVAVDDAYILFRYAEHLAAGDGLVFWPGERVLGVTAPAYAALLALVHLATGLDFPDAACALHVSAMAAASVFAAALCRGPIASAVVGLFPLALAAMPTVREVVGMEGTTFVAAALGTIWLAVRGRGVSFALAAVATCLVRPEGALLGLLLFAVLWARAKRFPRGAFVAGACATGAWIAYATAVHGTVGLHTANAKRMQAESPLWVVTWLDDLPRVLWANFGVTLAVVALALVVIVRRRCGVGMLVLAWAVLHGLAYSLARVPSYPWYHVPTLAQLAFLGALGTARGVELAVVRRAPSPALVRGSVLGVALAVTSVLAVATPRAEPFGRVRPPSHDRYYHLGRWLDAHAGREDAVGCVEVGIVGYYARRPIVDFLGLVTPHLADHVVDLSHIETAMAQSAPELVLAHDPLWRHETGLDRWLDRDYVLVRTLEDSRVFRRWTGGERELAHAAAHAAGDFRGAVWVPALPPRLDFARFAAELSSRAPQIRATERGNGAGALLQLGADGRWTLERGVFDDVPIAREELRAVAGTLDVAAAGVRVEGPPPVVGATIAREGPFSAVVLGLRIETGGVPAGPGYLTWTSSSNARPGPPNFVRFVTRATAEVQQVRIELPRLRFPTGEVLEEILLAPFSVAGRVTIESVTLER